MRSRNQKSVSLQVLESAILMLNIWRTTSLWGSISLAGFHTLVTMAHVIPDAQRSRKFSNSSQKKLGKSISETTFYELLPSF